MKFTSRNYHKSTAVETFASELSAIEFIIGFRKRNPKVFKVIITIVITIAAACVLFFAACLIVSAVISAKEAPQASSTEPAIQTVRLESCTIVSASQLQIDAYLDVDLSILTLKMEYIESDGNVFFSDFVYFENLSAGACALIVNMENGVDLSTCEVRVTVV